MWIGLTVAAFFIHNDWFVKYWGYFGLVGAFIYMIIQVRAAVAPQLARWQSPAAVTVASC